MQKSEKKSKKMIFTVDTFFAQVYILSHRRITVRQHKITDV